jgi:hypothetical protein
LLAGAAGLLIAAFACALALSLPALARQPTDMGPAIALDNKIRLNRWAFIGLVFAAAGAGAAAVVQLVGTA